MCLILSKFHLHCILCFESDTLRTPHSAQTRTHTFTYSSIAATKARVKKNWKAKSCHSFVPADWFLHSPCERTGFGSVCNVQCMAARVVIGWNKSISCSRFLSCRFLFSFFSRSSFPTFIVRRINDHATTVIGWRKISFNYSTLTQYTEHTRAQIHSNIHSVSKSALQVHVAEL